MDIKMDKYALISIIWILTSLLIAIGIIVTKNILCIYVIVIPAMITVLS